MSQAFNHLQVVEQPAPDNSEALRELANCGSHLVEHIAKLKVLYRSTRFADEDLTEQQILDSCPGDYGDSFLVMHLMDEAIEIHAELAKVKSLLKQ